MDDGLPCSGLDNNTASLPLLMEHMSSVSDQEHVVVNVTSMRPTISVAPHDGMSGSVESQEGTSSSGTDAQIERASPSTARTNFGRGGELRPFRRRQRTSTLNPGLWIFIKFTITIGQILASIIVLSVSRNEKPEAPLFGWIIGYAAGCVATLPHLYWRYKNRYVRASVHDPSSTSFVTQSNPPSSEDPYYTAISMPEASLQEGGESSQASNNNSDTISRNQRIGVLIGRFKMAVDCFFAVWFVVGNVWVFGSQSSARNAPNLYRLCIVFLAFSCIGYAMPFIFCGIICCCLPCMISILRWREDQTQTRGASMEVIDSMPKYKFKEIRFTERNSSRDDSETDSETSCNGGVIGAGTGNERPVSAEDAVCCICLSRYKDGEELRELPCVHCFHVDCVDKWLQRNASCPLCKHYISESSERTPDSTGEIGQRSEGQTLNNT